MSLSYIPPWFLPPAPALTPLSDGLQPISSKLLLARVVPSQQEIKQLSDYLPKRWGWRLFTSDDLGVDVKEVQTFAVHEGCQGCLQPLALGRGGSHVSSS